MTGVSPTYAWVLPWLPWATGFFALCSLICFSWPLWKRIIRPPNHKIAAITPNMKISDAIDYIVNDSLANLEKPTRPESLGSYPPGTVITVSGAEHQDARRKVGDKLNCGEMKSWGLPQIITHIPNQFERSLREIPQSYWNEMQLDFQSCLYYRGPYPQTMKIPMKPETYHWADVMVSRAQVESFWPKKPLASRVWARIIRTPRISHTMSIHI